MLTSVPSALIRHAVKDSRSLNRDVYSPAFGAWHRYSIEKSKCFICFAGAVIAGSLGGNFKNDAFPVNFPKEKKRLVALDYFRRGMFSVVWWRVGMDELGTETGSDNSQKCLKELQTIKSSVFAFESWEEYDTFLEDMEKAADVFEKYGM